MRPDRIRSTHLFLLAFLAALYVPLGLSFFSVGGVSILEKRVLAGWPRIQSLPDLERFPARFDAFFRDNFGLRDSLVALHFRLVSGPLFARIRHDVLVGKDGWLFWGSEEALEDIRGDFPPPTEKELHEWLALMERRREMLRQVGTELLVVIAPDKPTVYPEYLPDGIRAPGATTKFEYLTRFLAGKSTDWILDLRPVLLEAKERSRHQLYYTADSHWNMLGGYFAHKAIEGAITRLGLKVNPNPIREADFVFDPDEQGGEFLYLDAARIAKGGFVPRHPVLSCIRAVEVPKFSEVEYLVRNTNATECARGNLRVVAISDSFLVKISPYLSSTFRRVVYTGIGNQMQGTRPLVAAEKPDLLIYGIVERRITFRKQQWPIRY